MDWVNESVLASADLPWVYALVFACVLVDAFFAPLPSDVVLVGLAALSISAGAPNTWAIGLAAALGAIAGDNISYQIGRRTGVERWRWTKTPRAQRVIASAREASSAAPSS